MTKKVLWISRVGFSCSYHYVTKTLWETMKDMSNYEFYFQTTTISPTRETIDTFLKDFNIPEERFIFPQVCYDMSTPEDRNFETLELAGYNLVIETIKRINPHLVFVLDDTGPVEKMSERFSRAFEEGLEKNFLLIAYIPIDCNKCSFHLKKCIYDYYLTPTSHGKREIENVFGGKVYLLPHAVTVRRRENNYEDEIKEFVILSVNGNHIRKRWDLVFEVFLRFAREYGKPTRLIVKTNMLKSGNVKASLVPDIQYDLAKLYSQMIERNFAPNAQIEIVHTKYTLEQMDKLYDLAHVGLYMTSGEGFGLTPLEGAAKGIPQIVPDNTSFRELFPYYPYRVKTDEVPIFVGREGMNIHSLSFICLFKSYIYDKVENEERNSLPISNIPTFLISPYTTTMNFGDSKINPLQTFPTLDRYIVYKYEHPLPSRFQILLSVIPHFLQNLSWNFYPQNLFPSEKRHNLYLKIGSIRERFTSDKGTVEIPFIQDAVSKLKLLASNKEERIRAGKQCYNYSLKYTPQEVGRCFINFLKRIDTRTFLPPVILFSYERSGTHFLINSLSSNFGYDERWVDIDGNVDTYISEGSFENGLIYKCHYCHQKVAKLKINQCKLIRLRRRKKDNLQSYRKYLWMVPWNEGPKCEKFEEFLSLKTSGMQERYQDKQSITQTERYDLFHSSYDECGWDITTIFYEDLIDYNNFSNTMMSLKLKSYVKPTKVDLTIM